MNIDINLPNSLPDQFLNLLLSNLLDLGVYFLIEDLLLLRLFLGGACLQLVYLAFRVGYHAIYRTLLRSLKALKITVTLSAWPARFIDGNFTHNLVVILLLLAWVY